MLLSCEPCQAEDAGQGDAIPEQDGGNDQADTLELCCSFEQS